MQKYNFHGSFYRGFGPVTDLRDKNLQCYVKLLLFTNFHHKMFKGKARQAKSLMRGRVQKIDLHNLNLVPAITMSNSCHGPILKIRSFAM